MELLKDEIESGSSEALLVENDLFLAVRIESALKRMGYLVRTVGNAAEAQKAIREHPLALAVVTFGKEALNPVELTRQLKALPVPPPVLGYISHVRLLEVRAAAKEAGCDLLVPNSAVSMRLPQLVERLLARDIAAAEQIAAEAE